MKMRNPILSLILIIVVFVLVLGTVLFLTLRPETQVWYSDYDVAQEAAARENKDILLFFDGSSWDDASSQLKKDIFSNSSFMETINDRLIPVALDIPIVDGETEMTDQQKKNLEVADLLAIPQVPEILLMTDTSYIYGELTYEPGVTDYRTFMAELEAALAGGEKFKELLDRLPSTDGPEKVLLIDQLLENSPGTYIFQFYKLIYSVPDLDPTNETGLTGKYKLIIAYTQSVESWFNDDPVGAAEIYSQLADDPLLTPEEKQEAYYKAATMCYYSNLNDLMKEYLQKSIDAAPETENAMILQATLNEYIQEEQALLNAAP